MRLTTSIRSAFVRAAMNDVPVVDYTTQAQKLILDDCVKHLPPAVAKVWKDPKIRHYIKQNYHNYYGFAAAIPHPCSGGYRGEDTRPLAPEVDAQVKALAEAKTAQEATLKALREKLTAAANACTTRKQLAEMLPEFDNYLPADEAKALQNLPVVANLVGDFVKAGWPKHLKRPQKKAA